MFPFIALLAVHFLAVSSTFPTFPDDTSAHISSYLDSQSLVRYLASSQSRRHLRDRVKTFHVDSSVKKESNDFSFLAGYPNLEEVYLKRLGVPRISFLASLTRIRVLDLTGYFGPFDMCAVLPSAETLEVARLQRLVPNSRQCMTNFRRLKKLVVFQLDDLSTLLGSLEELEINSSNTNTLEALAALKRLNTLKVLNAPALTDSLRGLEALHATLEELELYAVNLETVAPIGNMSRLCQLNLGSGAVISDLGSELGRLTQLQHLKIRSYRLPSLAFLVPMGKNLKTLSVSNVHISDLHDFRNLQNLESLEIVDTLPGIGDISGMRLLSNLKELRLFSMTNRFISWQPLSLLSKLKTLSIYRRWR